MSYIIKSPDELKDPFLCYCIFQRFMEEAGEDMQTKKENGEIIDYFKVCE